jgi:hypothetical protein
MPDPFSIVYRNLRVKLMHHSAWNGLLREIARETVADLEKHWILVRRDKTLCNIREDLYPQGRE